MVVTTHDHVSGASEGQVVGLATRIIFFRSFQTTVAHAHVRSFPVFVMKVEWQQRELYAGTRFMCVLEHV
jgi:hypothetical protein